MNIPIVVVAYNRLDSLSRLLDSLRKARYPKADVELIISIDHGDNQDVVEYAEAFSWPHGKKTVRTFSENQGLKRHILSCGDLTQSYDGIILLEDDLYVSRDFYCYALEACAFLGEESRVGGISLYNHRTTLMNSRLFEPVCDGYDNWYFQFASSWGQIWTKQQWRAFRDWYQENEAYDFQASLKIPHHIKAWGKHSWLKYYIAYLIETDRYFMYPRTGFSTNFSDAGVNHAVNDTLFQVPLMCSAGEGSLNLRFSSLEQSQAVYDAWFENRKLEVALGAEGVCVDLYGEKEWFENKPYLLTSSRLSGAEAIRTFGREMRPQDMNILENIPGDRLTLYRLGENARKIDGGFTDKAEEVDYFFRGMVYRFKKTVVRMFLKETVQKIKRRLCRK